MLIPATTTSVQRKTRKVVNVEKVRNFLQSEGVLVANTPKVKEATTKPGFIAAETAEREFVIDTKKRKRDPTTAVASVDILQISTVVLVNGQQHQQPKQHQKAVVDSKSPPLMPRVDFEVSQQAKKLKPSQSILCGCGCGVSEKESLLEFCGKIAQKAPGTKSFCTNLVRSFCGKSYTICTSCTHIKAMKIKSWVG